MIDAKHTYIIARVVYFERWKRKGVLIGVALEVGIADLGIYESYPMGDERILGSALDDIATVG